MSKKGVPEFWSARLETLKEWGADWAVLTPEQKAKLENPVSVSVPASSGSQFTGSVDGSDFLGILKDEKIGACTRCALHRTRTNLVFGEGNPNADIMFVGEGPGADEDEQGRPFVGKAGQLLTKIIEGGMGLKRDQVYIANVVKCRPPGNRDPEPDEVDSCMGFLLQQIEIIDPKVVFALGRYAAHTLLDVKTPITRLRGELRDWQGRKLMPTYHPSYLLRNPSSKRDVWQDIKTVMSHLDMQVPARQ